MITRVIKRDGREAVFNIEKIANAIHKALDASEEVNARDPNRSRSQISLNLASQVADRIDEAGNSRPTIEQIQDIVEQTLMENGYPETAKRYIIYRSERTRVREMKTHLMQTFHALNPLSSDDSEEARSASEVLLQYGLTGAQSYNLLYLLRPEVSQAHQNRDIYLHDLETYALTFADFPLDLKKLFAGGFQSGEVFFQQPEDIGSYAALATLAASSALREISGCLTYAHFDRVMAEGVAKTRRQKTERYEALLKDLPALTAGQLQTRATELALRETDQATSQAMTTLLQSFSTGSFLSPHHRGQVSIQFGLETSAEARLVSRELLLAALQNQSPIADTQLRSAPSANTPQSPLRLVFLLASGINLAPEDPNYDLFELACHCAAQKGVPHFAFSDPTAKSLAQVTINLPRCAILARNDLNLFYHRLDQVLDLAIGAQLERLSTLKALRCRNFPLLFGQVPTGQEIGHVPQALLTDAVADHHLTIGFVGLAETLVSLIGRHQGQFKESDQLGQEIVKTLRETIELAADRHGVQIALKAEQDEQVRRDLLVADRTRFGKIAGVTDQPAYSRGFSLPDRFPVKPTGKIRAEAPYHHLVHQGQVLVLERMASASAEPVALAKQLEQLIVDAVLAGIKQVIWSA